nr:integrase, catalytic region, zinc finger, CCHC-type, peptidase aspartic, catalytic [Tanacetum cinerariifolium]
MAEVDKNTTPESTDMSQRGGEIEQNADPNKYQFPPEVDVNNVLSKPVTPYYFPKVRKSAPAKPYHVNAPSSSRNSKKKSYGSNDMAHNYYLEEAKKKTPDQKRNLKPREMPSAKTHHTPNACTPKPRSNYQTSRNWPASKSLNADLTGSLSSTMVEQDAPSTSNSTTPTETQSSVIPQDVGDDNLDMEVAHMGSDLLVEPKTYKEALTQSCWIEAMQEELHEFECLEVWELVPRPDK